MNLPLRVERAAVEPRPYQIAARERVAEVWARGEGALLVMATGTGKTVTGLLIARDVPGRVVWLAHRQELLDQPLQALWYDRDQAGIVQAGRDASDARIVFASKDTLLNERRMEALLAHGHPELLVVDEAHHSVSPSYRAVIDRLRGATTRLLGLTATADREDDADLSELWTVAYSYGIVQAIDTGFLLPPYAAVERIPGFDPSAVSGRRDYDDAELGEALLAAHVVEHTVAAMGATHPAVRLPRRDDERPMSARGRSCLVFTATVEQARLTAAALCGDGWRARWVSGETPTADRRRLLAGFARGEVDALCNAAVLTEGTDLPRCSCVVLARPTRSWTLYCLDSETEVLTPAGWMNRHQVGVGDLVAGFDRETGAIRWTRATGKISRPLNRDEHWVRMSSPSVDIRVTDRHNMLIRGRREAGPWRLVPAAELLDRQSGFRIPVAGVQDAPGVPLSDDELRFVGWFMSDGTLNRANGCIQISQAEHQPQIADLEACLTGCGFRVGISTRKGGTAFNETSPRRVYSISRGAARERGDGRRGWGAMAPYLDKDLSPLLEFVTREQFAILLQAIHLGDGDKQVTPGQTWTRRSFHISTGNRTFADRLQSLSVRRGFRANVAEAVNTNGNPIFKVHIKDETERSVGGVRQADRQRFEAEKPDAWAFRDHQAWCLENDLGTLVTRRHGKVAIVGNCQMVGRALRLHGDQTEGLILDLAGATEDHSLIAAPALVGGSRCQGTPSGVHRFDRTKDGKAECQHEGCGARLPCWAALQSGQDGQHAWCGDDEPIRKCVHCGRPQCLEAGDGRHYWIPSAGFKRQCMYCEAEIPMPLASLQADRAERGDPPPAAWTRLRQLEPPTDVLDLGEHGLVYLVGDDPSAPVWLPARARNPRPLTDGAVDRWLAEQVAGDLVRKARKVWDSWRKESLFGGLGDTGDVRDLRQRATARAVSTGLARWR